MALWTDIIDPATLTGFARAAQDDLEGASAGNLGAFLPTEFTDDIMATVQETSNGLVEVANYRAYDAELELGGSARTGRKFIELPALGKKTPIPEYDRLRTRNASDDQVLNSIQRVTTDLVRSVSDRIEYQRGILVDQGKAIIDQPNFEVEDDFGRSADMSVTAGTLWTQSGAKFLDDLRAWKDLYEEKNNRNADVLLVSSKVRRLLSNAPEFQTRFVDGSTRPATPEQIAQVLADEDLPQLQVYNRKVRRNGAVVRVLPEDKLYMLPSGGLGQTVYGRTLTATELGWGIPQGDQPGIVAGVFRNEQPPVIAEVIVDAIGMPLLANPDQAFVAKVA